MKKKSTTITFFTDPAQNSTLSFHSLFQKSSDTTSAEEAELIRVMYDAFRCGAFDDPSVGSHEDWNSLFNHYSFHWRRCSLQGAVAEKSIRQSFQQICRSFRSDDTTECLLYSLHTAETLDDLQHVLELQEQRNRDRKEAGGELENLCDVLWCAVTCLLRLFTISAPEERINDFQKAVRPIYHRFESLAPMSCRFVGWLLQGQEQEIERVSQQTQDVDAQRMSSHVLLVLNSLHGLLAPYTVQPELKGIAMLVDYRSVLLQYLQHLIAQGLTDIPVIYIQFLDDNDALLILSQLTQRCYDVFKTSNGKLFKPFSTLLHHIHQQKKVLQRLFYQWIIQYCQKDCCESEQEFFLRCKLLLNMIDESRNHAGLLWNAFCDMWNCYIATFGSQFLDVGNGSKSES